MASLHPDRNFATLACVCEDVVDAFARLEFAKAGTLLAAQAARRVLFCDAQPREGIEVRRTLSIDEQAGRVEAACVRPWLREQPSPGVLRVVINEGAGPFLCRPVQMGADVVVEDLGAMLGHEFSGVACVCARTDEVLERFLACVEAEPADRPGPACVAALALLLPQLSLITQARCDRALVAAQYLAHHPGVCEVSYPGLGQDAANPEARRSLEHGFGWRVAFRLSDEGRCFEEGLWEEPHRGLGSGVERLTGGAYVLHAGLEEPLDVVGALERGISGMQVPTETHNVAQSR